MWRKHGQSQRIKQQIIGIAICLFCLIFLFLMFRMDDDENVLRNYNVNEGKKKGVILSTYFTSAMDPQRNMFMDNNDFEYMRPLYESCLNHSLDLVIFHDSLSDEFVELYSNEYVQFVFVSLRSTISMNDERFLFYQKFLRENQNKYEFVMLSDISDVMLFANPFDAMKIQEDESNGICKYWILKEDTLLSFMVDNYKYCYGSKSLFTKKYFDTNENIYNAGVIGGRMENVQYIIESIIAELTRIPKGHNCNMIALQFIIQTNILSEDNICNEGMCWKNDICTHPFVHHKFS